MPRGAREGGAAFVALAAIRLRWNRALAFVWAFNIEGTADLVYAIAQGFSHSLSSELGAAYWIPSLLVPSLLVTHFMMFKLLMEPTETVR